MAACGCGIKTLWITPTSVVSCVITHVLRVNPTHDAPVGLDWALQDGALSVYRTKQRLWTYPLAESSERERTAALEVQAPDPTTEGFQLGHQGLGVTVADPLRLDRRQLIH